MAKPLRTSFLVIGMPTLMALQLGAQSSAIEKLRARLEAPEQFGTECCQLLSIPASAFVPRGEPLGGLFTYGSLGFMFPGSNVYWAPVTLPTGAVLDNIDLYAFDTDPNADICAILTAFSGPTLLGSSPSEDVIEAVCSSGSAGYDYALEPIIGGETIDNSVWFSGGAQYAVVVNNQGGATGALGFKGVTIWWHREVSPPPGTATFNDVPTNHPQFQFIEALAESGITVGCGAGNYCPDSSLTRGQMAVFLAKALGLYWPF
jgi:hypothetical protein